MTPDNFFPPLPADTKIVGVEYGDDRTHHILEDLRDATKLHMPINFDIFDEFGIEITKFSEAGDVQPLNPWRLKLLHKSPPVIVIENFLADEECEEIKAVTHSDDNREIVSPPHLSRDSMSFR